MCRYCTHMYKKSLTNLTKEEIMNLKKIQAIDMHLESVLWYSNYVDCLTRIINEFIENGETNLNPNDIPNLVELLSKFSRRLHLKLMKMKADWEFMQ